MPIDEYLDCPVCGEAMPEELEGKIVRFCPFCGEELELAEVREYGLDPNGYETD